MVSFYWLLTCIPVVTIIPACTALFHTVTKSDSPGWRRRYSRFFFPLFAMRCIQGCCSPL
ncbi:DUF624 domain-containing protein [Ruthenibacterium lactatiformans]|uniref:DUF624 domain-containing protein n=1 Tax=Ruthenibacterium lactatiformans TaxID=1550024 RepID=UPI00352220A4